MDFYFNGQWSNGSQQLEVRNPFDGSVIDTVPVATESEVTEAITGAAGGFEDLKKVSAHQRSLFLRRAADLLGQRSEDFARIISQEEGKTLKEARGETARAVQTMELSAEEAKRLEGEVLPLDGAGGAAGKLGITLRVPCGIVAAITPFNFPLNLVCHKVGPALAAGNAVLIKPASDTPLTSLMLVEILLEAGCPPRAISCLTGGGSSVGRVLCEDPRIRKISFTGSKEVGESICRRAGLKRVTMELGSNCPLVVLPDADLQKVVDAIALSGYANAGQVCISAQRVIVHREVQEELLQRLVPRIADLQAGNPLDEDSSIGPMVREADAVRVESWIEEAVQGGAELLCGGQRQDALVSPALLTGVQREMKLAREELFGPAVGMMLADDIDSAIRQANDSPYGLSAAVFTQNVDHALRFANQVESGNIHINWGPLWRTDMMPYGGLKESGFGKEGPRYAIQEMTETKAVIFHSDF
ncbi:MAG: aldehyde dehydrogenase family protein [Planctomycetota bacterium]|nr:aldehyde dehydrogenase family protein [Planctomycetota bacterium]